jgi:alpha-ketoglutarate-dependent taurine dioxygenase
MQVARLADRSLIPVTEGKGALVEFAAFRVEDIKALIAEHGVLLFRGFDVLDGGGLGDVMTNLFGRSMDYLFRSTPRTAVGGKVFTATEYPRNHAIPLHSELSYHRDWPMHLIFGCVQPAEQGGETPIADLRAVTRRLGAQRVARFAERRVLYVRNYRHSVDLPWQTVFQTEDRGEVERYCAGYGIEWEWLGEGQLRTRHVSQGVATRAGDADAVWFNQAHLFHVSALPEEVREALVELFGEDGLPRHAYYGDGEPIADEEIAAVNAAFDAERIYFQWQPGDALLVDNMRFAHGRMPYEGKRRVLVAMASPFSETAVPSQDGGAAKP